MHTCYAQDGQPTPEATVFPHVALAEVLAEVFTQVHTTYMDMVDGLPDLTDTLGRSSTVALTCVDPHDTQS